MEEMSMTTKAIKVTSSKSSTKHGSVRGKSSAQKVAVTQDERQRMVAEAVVKTG